MDEFGEMHAASLLHQGKVPFIDFDYGKPLLMQFFLQPIFYLTSNPVELMWLARSTMLLLSVALCVTVYLLAKDKFGERAGWLSVLILVLCSTEIERSIKIRTDNITVLFFMVSITCALAGFRLWWKELLAGIAIGITPFVTQKAIYFVVAMIPVMGWRLLIKKNLNKQSLILFLLGAIIPGIVYIGYTLLNSDIYAFLDYNVFQASQHLTDKVFQYQLDKYYSIVFLRDPVFWYLSLTVLACRLIKTKIKDESAPIYWASLIVICGFFYHNVPWPYFFVTMIPLLAIGLGADLVFFYSKMNSRLKQFTFLFILTAIFSASTFYRFPRLSTTTNNVQIQTIVTAEDILEPGDAYFDGLWMLFTKATADSINLIAPNLFSINNHPVSLEKLIDNLKENKCALIIYNYRIQKLAPIFQKFFFSHYLPVTGRIYTSGVITKFSKKGCKKINLIAEGNYRIATYHSNAAVTIDGITPIGEMTLDAGIHTICVDNGPAFIVLQYYHKGAASQIENISKDSLFLNYDY